MAHTLLLGLTGGIGSGKSTAGSLFAARGAMLIDADAISRALTASGGAAIPAIALQLGAEFITAQGALDRDRMREKAFADPTVKHRKPSTRACAVPCWTSRYWSNPATGEVVCIASW